MERRDGRREDTLILPPELWKFASKYDSAVEEIQVFASVINQRSEQPDACQVRVLEDQDPFKDGTLHRVGVLYVNPKIFDTVFSIWYSPEFDEYRALFPDLSSRQRNSELDKRIGRFFN